MKLKEARDAYYDYSKSASGVGRQLAFAGIAVIWLFHRDGDGGPVLPSALLVPLVLVVLSLSLDLAHYLSGTIAWGCFARRQELLGREEFRAPRWINWATITCFWAKLASVMIAYAMLAVFVFRQIFE